jgi:hypothetical protein
METGKAYAEGVTTGRRRQADSEMKKMTKATYDKSQRVLKSVAATIIPTNAKQAAALARLEARLKAGGGRFVAGHSS